MHTLLVCIQTFTCCVMCCWRMRMGSMLAYTWYMDGCLYGCVCVFFCISFITDSEHFVHTHANLYVIIVVIVCCVVYRTRITHLFKWYSPMPVYSSMPIEMDSLFLIPLSVEMSPLILNWGKRIHILIPLFSFLSPSLSRLIQWNILCNRVLGNLNFMNFFRFFQISTELLCSQLKVLITM